MTHAVKITVSLASIALIAGMTACAPTPASTPAAAETSTPTPEKTSSAPERSFPEYVPSDMLWLVYPAGFQCQGTEGCPNNFVSTYGDPGSVLPEGVEYYDPIKHNYNRATGSGMVFPAEQLDRDCDSPKMPPLGVTPIDQGPQKGAMGEVEVVDGVPTSYVVADNDSLPAIGERFCIDYATIGAMTDIERNRDIYPGDVLTLRP